MTSSRNRAAHAPEHPGDDLKLISGIGPAAARGSRAQDSGAMRTSRRARLRSSEPRWPASRDTPPGALPPRIGSGRRAALPARSPRRNSPPPSTSSFSSRSATPCAAPRCATIRRALTKAGPDGTSIGSSPSCAPVSRSPTRRRALQRSRAGRTSPRLTCANWPAKPRRRRRTSRRPQDQSASPALIRISNFTQRALASERPRGDARRADRGGAGADPGSRRRARPHARLLGRHHGEEARPRGRVLDRRCTRRRAASIQGARPTPPPARVCHLVSTG